VYGVKAIVPGILLTSLITLLLTGHYAAKLSFARLTIGFAAMRSEGKEMLSMGFLISLSSIVTLAFSYVVRLFVGHYGSVEDVGLYNAGFAIVNTYVGMIFAAMATDYYPKLSAVAHDVKKTNESVNQQAEIALLILSPILLVFIVCIKWVIVLLYSEAFLPVDNMILFAAAGMLFKTLSWAIAFIFLARGASQLFFWNELIANVYILGLNLAGYYGYGLTGLGLSFLISYMLYALQVYLVSKKRFGYVMGSELFLLFSVNAAFISIGLISVQFFTPLFAYLTGGGLFTASAILSLYFLDKRLGWRAKYR
jgi:O-antigen/teichoic acid export membrane protein